MKKIIFVALSALAALFVSCDMDKYPYDAIVEDKYMQTIDDAINMSVSIYSPTKGFFGGGRWDVEEIRGGMFNATANFGNFYGLYYAWIMQNNDSDAEGLWYSDYAIIASVNYIIDSYGRLLETNEDLEDEEKELLRQYIAEAHMTRAMAYWDLVTKYCVGYEPTTAANEMGVPLQLEYAPTSDSSKYPGRNTLEETYAQILADLEQAANITREGSRNANYWTIDAVNAMRARVYLNMKDYENAGTIAQQIINKGTYQLVQNEAEMNAMWFGDTSNENIFLVAANLNDLPTSTGNYFIYDNEKGDGSTPNPQYIPSKTLLDLYGATDEEKAKDLRYKAYFQERNVTVEGVGTEPLMLFWKWAGNPDLKSGPKLAYRSAGKPFRIAEQYLIAAEAAAQLGQNSTALKYLNDLRRTRIADYTDLPAATDVMQVVKEEWSREFVGEGFRMINMKRWTDAVVRGESQNPLMTKPGADYDGLSRQITDYRCVWPIPKVEIDANPQIKGQQNPGY